MLVEMKRHSRVADFGLNELCSPLIDTVCHGVEKLAPRLHGHFSPRSGERLFCGGHSGIDFGLRSLMHGADDLP